MSEVVSEAVCYLVGLLEDAAETLRAYGITPWTIRRMGKTWSLSLQPPGPLTGLVSRAEDAEWSPIGGYVGLYTQVSPPVLDAIKCTLLDWQAWLKANGEIAVAQEFDGYAARILGIVTQLEADAGKKVGSRPGNLAAVTGDATAEPDAMRLMRIYAPDKGKECMRQLADIINDSTLNVDDKLRKLNAILPIPISASLRSLAQALGVSASAIRKTRWWKEHRTHQKEVEIEERRCRLVARGEHYDRDD
ncbi:hypothetical protein [Thermogutta terrifontis]|uniref:hypothetical protein n=1 Tax=Thermogutta terrifontis TaxID=1331910 RepID=UPI0012FDBAF9|nr:hypothetical protein [Thermogutta terrifontis]